MGSWLHLLGFVYSEITACLLLHTCVCVTAGVNRPFFREKQVIRVFRVLLKIFFLGKMKSWYRFGNLQHFEEGLEFSVTLQTLGTTGLESQWSERPSACVVGLAWFSVSGFSKTRTHPRTCTHTAAHTGMHTLFQANRLSRWVGESMLFGLESLVLSVSWWQTPQAHVANKTPQLLVPSLGLFLSVEKFWATALLPTLPYSKG